MHEATLKHQKFENNQEFKYNCLALEATFVKRVFSLFFVLNAAFLFSCAQRPDAEQVSGDAIVLIPWYNSTNKRYEMTPMKLTGLSSLSQMSGSFVNFFLSPSIRNNRLQGDRPQAQFLKSKNGYFVAKDEVSLQMATIYSILEGMARLDEKVGAGGINVWPRDVGIGVVMKVDGMVIRNNAFFDGNSDSILFLNYNQKGLQIPLNNGIIAHEHFHSLFYKIVLKKLRDENKINLDLSSPHRSDDFKLAQIAGINGISGDLENIKMKEDADKDKDLEKQLETYFIKFFVSGLNEGFADYWAWLFTDNPDFLSVSLISEEKFRTLNYDSSKLLKEFFTKDDIKTKLHKIDTDSYNPDEDMLGLAYVIGTQYARWLKLFSENMANEKKLDRNEAKLLMAQALISYLPKLKENIIAGLADNEASKKDSLVLSPQTIISGILESIPNLKVSDCKFATEFLNNLEPTKKDWKCIQSGDPKSPNLKIIKP